MHQRADRILFDYTLNMERRHQSLSYLFQETPLKFTSQFSSQFFPRLVP